MCKLWQVTLNFRLWQATTRYGNNYDKELDFYIYLDFLMHNGELFPMRRICPKLALLSLIIPLHKFLRLQLDGPVGVKFRVWIGITD
jgi:hypothetical protein